MKKTLRPYQMETVQILAGGGLNASGLGAGKTLMAVEGVRELRLGRPPRILVVAPVNTLVQWRRTFAEQFPSLEAKNLLHIVGTPQKDPKNWARLTRKQPGVYLISWNAMHGGIPEEIRREGSSGRGAIAKNPPVTQNAVRKAIAAGRVPPWTRTGVWDLLVLDEVHRASNQDGVPRHVLKVIRADRRLGLSHTPGGNRPGGLWTVLNLIWPDRYRSYWTWVGEHFRVEEKEVYQRGSDGRPQRKVVNEIGPEIRPGGVWDDIPAVVRYRTEDVYAQLPPVIERTVQVAMTPGQEEQYLDFLEQSLAWLSDQPVAAPLPLEQRIRLRQAALGELKAEEAVRHVSYLLSRPEQKVMEAWRSHCADHPEVTPEEFTEVYNDGIANPKRHLKEGRMDRILAKQAMLDQGVEFEEFSLDRLDISYEETAIQLKLDAVREILADLPEGEPLLVWTHSAKWARMAEKLLGSKAVSWTASTTAAKRRKIEAGFGTEWRILVAQLQSLSEGVDWLKENCRCEVIASATEDEVMNIQAEGRLHRPGQTSPVQRWRLDTEGTIDEDVSLNNLEKRLRMGRLYKDFTEGEEAA